MEKPLDAEQLYLATREFIKKFLKDHDVEHDPADPHVGIPNDTWYVDSDTLTDMMLEFCKKLSK